MANLVKTKGIHFKKCNSGNIRWYFGKDDFIYYGDFLAHYVGDNYNAYYRDPLLYSVIWDMYVRYFAKRIPPESIKIKHFEAVALLLLLEKLDEKGFLYYELKQLLSL